MDPPTTYSTSSGMKILHSSPRPSFFMDDTPQKYCSMRNSPIFQRSSTVPLHRSRNVAKIIKGEIHNVLTVMRSDPRYYTTGSDGGKNDAAINGRSRFEFEERQHNVGMGRFWSSDIGSSGSGSYRGMMRRLHDSTNNNLSTTTRLFAAHPILQGLRDLYDLLSSFESDFYERKCDRNLNFPLKATSFVPPFAAAVFSPDVDAKTTEAALSALHKFIVYGFLEGSSSSTDDVRQSITTVARCIRQFSFEERTSVKNSTGSSKGIMSYWSSKKNKQKTLDPFMFNYKPTSFRDDKEGQPPTESVPLFLLEPRRLINTKGSSTNTKSVSFSSEKENVLLKVLSLSVQVLRCSAGRYYLLPSDIVGIFDTCLFVLLNCEGAKHSLLRSAAADALSHCVMVVFGMHTGCVVTANNHVSMSQGVVRKTEDDNADPTAEDGSLESDDEWGERDPTLCVEDSFLVNRFEPHKASPVNNDRMELGISHQMHEHQAKSTVDDEEPALVAIMARLVLMADPLIQQDDTCVLSLTLINIALETAHDVDALASNYSRLLHIMQNDLCRNLLRLSTSHDLTLLGLALRVIFNLFNGIKHHMKLQLEVFLTSVHLRMLGSSTSPTTHQQVWSSPPEYRELALESLLEFCREPMLMMDLYLNYDCDINCTNLFETICITLAKVANPDENHLDTASIEQDESIIAVINSISKRCHLSSRFHMTPFSIVGELPGNCEVQEVKSLTPNSGNSGVRGANTSEFCSMSSSSDISTPIKLCANTRTNSDMSDLDVEVISNARHYTSLALRERKMRKRRLAKATSAFNESSRNKEWITELERLGVIPNPATPKSVATFLYSTSEKLDKVKIGEYISKGPKEKYPFIEQVLREFTRLFDFSSMSFSESLRLFLSTFRLPGEAQCIDRLMEAFALRLYESQVSSRQNVNKCANHPGLVDPPTSYDTTKTVLPFHNSDAAFILAFSTIMLNTDLHNPNMDDNKRMTIEEFIRNNRGINDGVDLPSEFLEELYYDIKNNEIKMKDTSHDFGDLDVLLVERANTAVPFFTSSFSAQSKLSLAGVHDRDMFTTISSATSRAISTVFIQSWDDSLVMKALNGLKVSANVCSYFGLDRELDQIINLLLSWGHDYIDSVALINSEDEITSDKNRITRLSTEKADDDSLDIVKLNTDLASRDLPSLPSAFVTSLNFMNQSYQLPDDFAGCAAHRGLLSLDGALELCKNHLYATNEALPTLFEVMFSLRDIDALPLRLADLDDFADSKGNPLSPSSYALNNLERISSYKNSILPSANLSPRSKFFSIFNYASSYDTQQEKRKDTHPLIKVLKAVSKNASLDQIIMKMNDVGMAKRVLSSMLVTMYPDDFQLFDDPFYEQNAVFVLELANRLLISNRSHATELLPLFVSTFETIFAQENDADDAQIVGLKFPYLLERLVVTILRAVIHLYDVPDRTLRTQLMRSMELITSLPYSYTKEISSRIGCGASIVLRGCFLLFESPEEWFTIRNLLDVAARHETGRSFVFDGIASLVEYAFPVVVDGKSVLNEIELSVNGCEAIRTLLLKFLDGAYENDLNYKLPSVLYMKRVYSQQPSRSHLQTSNYASKGNSEQSVEWTKMVSVLYHDICRSDNMNTSKRGFESLQEVILSTKVDSITDHQWLSLIEMACTDPPLTTQASRIDSLNLIERLFLTLVPKLSNKKENWACLEKFTLNLANIIAENLQSDRLSSLFEITVHTVTNMCNVMSMAGFGNGKEINFCSWVGETLICELEKVGAAGGVASAN